MENFYSLNINIPAVQLAALQIINTLSLLFGRIKLALLVTYIFTLYWGFILNQEINVGVINPSELFFFIIYFGFGLGIVVFSLIGFLAPTNR